MTIGKKLLLAFGVAFMAAFAISGMSLWTISGLNARFDKAISTTAHKLQLVSELTTIKSDLLIAQRGIVLGSFMKDKTELAAQQADFENQMEQLNRKIEELRPLISLPQAKVLFPVFENDFTTWRNEYPTVLRMAQSGHSDQAQRHSFERITPVYRDMKKIGDRLVNLYHESLEQDKRAATEAYHTAIWTSLISVGVLLAIGAIVIIVIQRISGSLRQMVIGLSESAVQVASASGQIASTSQSLSQGSSEQAASLEEVSASMEEMTAMTRRNAQNSSEAMAMMEETVLQVGRSNNALQEMMASMGAIKLSSEKVAKINKTIDEIAFQTNILALNAAVEAARAGEAGMGFAVVADEVRNLAQRSAVAAKDTAELIDEAIANSKEGSTRLELVAAAIRGITDSAGRVKNLVDEVSEASKQQTQGIGQVATAVTQVSGVTQTAAASAEEGAAAAEELSAQSQTVAELVEQLKAMVESSDSRSHSRKPAAD